MAYRQVAFAPDEYFHCYTRGIDQRITFQDMQDYERFLEILYVCNDTRPFRRDTLMSHSHKSILQVDRTEQLVAIVAYCLMPNHFHLILREIVEGGITRFMQKLGTAYTMYFNAKHERIGGLFIKPFRAKHIHDDVYLKQAIQYIHLNPAELYEPGWKEGVVKNMRSLKQNLSAYSYSSLPDFSGAQRAERSILDQTTIQSLYDTLPSLAESVHGAAEYYSSLRW